jgi:hypothetical protein
LFSADAGVMSSAPDFYLDPFGEQAVVASLLLGAVFGAVFGALGADSVSYVAERRLAGARSCRRGQRSRHAIWALCHGVRRLRSA